MESAFGVEHGEEIAKFSMPTGLLKPVKAIGSAVGGATRSAGSKTMVSGIKQIKTNPNMGGLGSAKIGVGGAARRAGSAMAAKPGLTGGAVLGGGGAAGYGMTHRNKQY